jgi:hypothetical protein
VGACVAPGIRREVSRTRITGYSSADGAMVAVDQDRHFTPAYTAAPQIRGTSAWAALGRKTLFLPLPVPPSHDGAASLSATATMVLRASVQQGQDRPRTGRLSFLPDRRRRATRVLQQDRGSDASEPSD